MHSSARRLLGTVSAGCALSAAVLLVPIVSAAQAARINFRSCNSSAVALGQAFSPWGDSSSYELVPGGDFEGSTSPWTLSGGAQVVPGSEPYAATGSLGASSLSLPAGASATSPMTCVDAADPTVRFFVGGTGTVALSLVYHGWAIPTGLAVAAGHWAPTASMLTAAPLLSLLSGGTAQVSLQLTGLTGSPQVDDVFVDPWLRGG